MPWSPCVANRSDGVRTRVMAVGGKFFESGHECHFSRSNFFGENVRRGCICIEDGALQRGDIVKALFCGIGKGKS